MGGGGGGGERVTGRQKQPVESNAKNKSKMESNKCCIS